MNRQGASLCRFVFVDGFYVHGRTAHPQYPGSSHTSKIDRSTDMELVDAKICCNPSVVHNFFNTQSLLIDEDRDYAVPDTLGRPR